MFSVIKELNKKRVKVLVVGDTIIDEYYSIKVERVSPEFPIPVHFSDDDKPINIVPGGASNTLNQLKYWNADCFLISVLDEISGSILKRSGVNTDFCIFTSNWRNSIKKRYYDGEFPTNRMDIESGFYNWKDLGIWDGLKKRFSEFIEFAHPEVVILSDYGKGVFFQAGGFSQYIVDCCFRLGIPTIVDPKSFDKNLWNGCHVLKPNMSWAKKYLEYKFMYNTNYNDLVTTISSDFNCSNLIITDSGNGVLVNKDYYSSRDLSQKRPVVRSVIGAGDAFTAILALGYAYRLEPKLAVNLAFNAATVYIEDIHNNPVSPYSVSKWYNSIAVKYVTLEELLQIKGYLNGEWVFTNGVFDLLHLGHVRSLKFAKTKGDYLVVAINSDESVKRLKGLSRPIIPLDQRIELIANLECVDFIVDFSDNTPIRLIEAIKPNFIVKGSQYKKDEVVGIDIADVVLLEMVDGISTTDIIKKCAKIAVECNI